MPPGNKGQRFSLRSFNTILNTYYICQAYTSFSSRPQSSESAISPKSHMARPFIASPKTLFHPLLLYSFPSSVSLSLSIGFFPSVYNCVQDFQLGRLTGQLWLLSPDSDFISWHRILLEWYPLLMSPCWAQLQDLPHRGTCQVLCTPQGGAQKPALPAVMGFRNWKYYHCGNH